MKDLKVPHNRVVELMDEAFSKPETKDIGLALRELLYRRSFMQIAIQDLETHVYKINSMQTNVDEMMLFEEEQSEEYQKFQRQKRKLERQKLKEVKE